MTWFRLDDSWLMHPRMRAAGKDGRSLFVAAGTYCAQQLTDGWIDKTVLPIIAAQAEVPAKLSTKLITVGVFEDHGDRIRVHDFLDYNPSREKVEAERKAAAERQQRARDKARESRQTSRRDSHQTNAVSHGPPDPTRPDPTTATYVSPPPPSTVGDPTVVDQAIEILADGEQMDAEYRGIEPDKGWTLYRTGIVKRLNTEHRARLTALHALTPDMPACDLAAVIAEEIYGDYGGRALNDTNGATA